MQQLVSGCLTRPIESIESDTAQLLQRRNCIRHHTAAAAGLQCRNVLLLHTCSFSDEM